MLVYIILYSLILLIGIYSYKNKLNSKYFLWIALFMMALVLGLRSSGVGEDTSMYLSMARVCQDKSFLEILKGFPKSEWKFIDYGNGLGYSDKIETFYLMYVKLIMAIFHNENMVLFITAFISYFCIGKFILEFREKNSDVYIILFVLLCDNIFMFSFNGMRQILAMSIFLQAFTCFKNNKKLSAILYIFIAFCIHQSTIIMIFPLFLYSFKNKKKIFKYVLMFSVILPMLLPVFQIIIVNFFPKYSKYLKVSYWEASIKGTILLWVFLIGVLLWIMLSKKKNEFDYYYAMLIILYLAFEFVAIRFTMLSRVSLYFRFFMGFFLCKGKDKIHGNSRVLYLMALFVLMSASFFSYSSSPWRIYSTWL